ncbi:hypothetical protein [Ensifer sp. NM-2]|uniref:hypothetical protein n=1 Tax=Ensifer sp. NM-2 TaxID=2109730 RepID=UPI001AECB629|nr:hypothetical protein [Ensifer sp. NM-2]
MLEIALSGRLEITAHVELERDSKLVGVADRLSRLKSLNSTALIDSEARRPTGQEALPACIRGTKRRSRPVRRVTVIRLLVTKIWSESEKYARMTSIAQVEKFLNERDTSQV